MMFSGFGGFESWRGEGESQEEFMRRMQGQGVETSGRAVLADLSATIGEVLVDELERSLANGADPSLTHMQWHMLVALARRGLRATCA